MFRSLVGLIGLTGPCCFKGFVREAWEKFVQPFPSVIDIFRHDADFLLAGIIPEPQRGYGAFRAWLCRMAPARSRLQLVQGTGRLRRCRRPSEARGIPA